VSVTKWKVTFQIHRQNEMGSARLDEFSLEVDPEEYVLDGIERVWAFHDRSLSYRHACHHSACGICGMRVNGVEKLTCITPIKEVTRDGGTIKVEPLRNFPVVSDLVVDMSSLYTQMEAVGYPQVAPIMNAPLDGGITPTDAIEDESLMRLNDCIECGLCISACTVATTTASYLGPAVLAGLQFSCLEKDNGLIDIADIGGWGLALPQCI
jgi:succinate dehydrogenase/fumarate reductase iron-sulfur protein